MHINILKSRSEVTADHIVYGMSAGLVASVVLAVLMLIKTSTAFYTDYNVLVVQANAFHMGESITASWLTHFIIGTFIWGTFYGLVNHRLGNTPVEKGIGFGLVIWFIAMVVLMPMSGAGFFLTAYGAPGLGISFGMHLIFGLTTAYVYRNINRA